MKQVPIKEDIKFEDFAKLAIRVGTILEVCEVAKSDKLKKLVVDSGGHTHSILACVKQERENLPERKMAGEASQGMRFDIGYEDRLQPCLACPESLMPNGARAG